MAGEKLVIKKKVKGGVVYTNGMFRLDFGIASYPHLLEAYAGEDGGTPKFSIMHLLDKEEHSGIIDEMRNTCKQMMADKKVKVASDKLFIKDGDKYYEEKPECANRYVISAREESRPTLRDAKGRKLDATEDKELIKELFYGGAVVSILINPWLQDNKYGKRINANLRAVRFVRDGEPFGEGRISDDDAWDEEDYSGEEADGGDSDWDDDDI